MYPYNTDLILSRANAQDTYSDPLTHCVFRSQEINAEQKTGYKYYLDPPPKKKKSRFYLTYVEYRCAALFLPAAQAVIKLEQGPEAASLPQQSVCSKINIKEVSKKIHSINHITKRI